MRRLKPVNTGTSIGQLSQYFEAMCKRAKQLPTLLAWLSYWPVQQGVQTNATCNTRRCELLGNSVTSVSRGGEALGLMFAGYVPLASQSPCPENRPILIPTYPKNPKICDPILVTLLKMRPHYSHSNRKNATPSIGTFLLVSCKGAPPSPPVRLHGA